MGLKDRPGLTDYLDQKSTLEAAVAATAQPNLSLIACGEPSARSGELFLHARFDTLLRGIATDFDYVLIDSAPVFATADTASLAPKTDGVLFVVRSSVTRPDTVRQALDQLYQRQAKVLGFIFNRADASSRDYLFYKYAGYSHPAAAVA